MKQFRWILDIDPDDGGSGDGGGGGDDDDDDDDDDDGDGDDDGCRGDGGGGGADDDDDDDDGCDDDDDDDDGGDDDGGGNDNNDDVDEDEPYPVWLKCLSFRPIVSQSVVNSTSVVQPWQGRGNTQISSQCTSVRRTQTTTAIARAITAQHVTTACLRPFQAGLAQTATSTHTPTTGTSTNSRVIQKYNARGCFVATA